MDNGSDYPGGIRGRIDVNTGAGYAAWLYPTEGVIKLFRTTAWHIDTSGLTPHELRDRIRESFADAPPEEGIQVSVVSFGFKFGAPRDADMQLDVRFLPNPHWVPELRPLPGTDQRVKDYVEAQDAYGTFIERVTALLDATVPGFVAEGKSYLTVSIGCTGGHHRSVVVAEALGAYFRARGLPVVVVHRDVDRG